MKKTFIILAAVALLLLLSLGVYFISIVIEKYEYIDQQLEEGQENKRSSPAADSLNSDSSRYQHKTQ